MLAIWQLDADFFVGDFVNVYGTIGGYKATSFYTINGTKNIYTHEEPSISHPVRQAPRISVFGEDDPAVDPLDGTLPRSRNVLFEAEGKHEYEPLNARINSELGYH